MNARGFQVATATLILTLAAAPAAPCAEATAASLGKLPAALCRGRRVRRSAPFPASPRPAGAR